MRKFLLVLIICLTGMNLFAQKPSITWGEEFKLRKGSTDLEVIHTDKSGVYLQEGHLALKSYFVIGSTVRSSASLIKMDKNFSKIFSTDFNRELKGKEFIQFFVLRDKMFIIASEYIKRESVYNVYAAEVDKATGELAGMWKQLTSIQKDEKKDEVDFKIIHNTDSTQMVIVSSMVGKEKNTYTIQEFNDALKSMGNAISVSNEFDPKTFQLEDVLYTINKRIILVGRVYEFREGKKKKEKFLDFANYNIRLYDAAGKQLKEINTTVDGKWLTSTKIVQDRNKDLILASFYSTNKKDRTIDGLLVQRIDPVNGEVIFTSDKKIDQSMLNAAIEEGVDEGNDDEESRQERKEREKLEKIKDEGEAFSRHMKFRNIYYTPDGGLILIAEEYNHYVYTTQTYSAGVNGAPGQWRTTTYSVYECDDLLLCKIDADRNIGWMKVLPKSQREVISGSRTSSVGWSFSSFFDPVNRPLYASFGSTQLKNSIFIFFNDNPKNAAVLQPGQKVKRVQRFGKSDCFVVTLDQTTGTITRKFFYSNADVPTSMPRLGSVIGNDIYIVGKDDRLFGKSKIAVAKISIK